jgi:hypothetical protein
MPSNMNDAIKFLETQWSNINANKLKGIEAEVRFRTWLTQNNVHYTSGGWVISSGENTNSKIPSIDKICLLPLSYHFSWQSPARAKDKITVSRFTLFSR